MVHSQEAEKDISQKNRKSGIEIRLTDEEEASELDWLVQLQDIPEWEFNEELVEVSAAVFCDRPGECFSHQIYKEKCLCIRRQFVSLASYEDFRQKIATQMGGLLLGELNNGND